MRYCKFCLSALLTALFLSLSAGANAILVSAAWIGVTQSAAPGNAVGVETGDFVFGHAVFDTDWLAQPFLPDFDVFVIVHDADPAFQMGVSIGNRTFTESEDADFGIVPFFPTIGFGDASSIIALENSWEGMMLDTCGTPVFPDCTTADGLGFGAPDVTLWAIFENGEEIASGAWRLDTMKIQKLEPIPVPAALPLLLGALGCLVGFFRRTA